MDLILSPEQETFRKTVRAWLAENAPEPFGSRRGKDAEYATYLRAWHKKIYEGGYVGLTWPKAYGGQGASVVEHAILEEELALANAPEIIGRLGVSLIGPTIAKLGTEEQKKRYLPPMLAGDEVWCQGFSEPNSGSDLASLGTRAVDDGDAFIVNGQKIWTSFAHVSDYCFLLVRTDPAAAKHKGITCLLVDMTTPGVEVKPLRMMSGDSGFNEIFFTDVRVPKTQVLGEVNGGWHAAITALMNERANLGGPARIGMSRFLDEVIKMAKTLERPAGGGSKIAAKDPVVRQKIADVYLRLEIFRMTSDRALSRFAQGGVPGPEGSILKLYWTQLNQEITRIAMEIAGPHGQLTGEDAPFDILAWAYLRSRGNTIEAGTSEVLKNIVAERVLGLPKSY